MVKFVAVEPEDIDNVRAAHRGRVSYPIIKSFLETGLPLAKLDRTGMQQSAQSLSMSLGSYIRKHELSVKIITRKGELYFIRTDLNEDGTKKTEAAQAATMNGQVEDLPEVDEDLAKELFATEKDQVTK